MGRGSLRKQEQVEVGRLRLWSQRSEQADRYTHSVTWVPQLLLLQAPHLEGVLSSCCLPRKRHWGRLVIAKAESLVGAHCPHPRN